MYRDLARYYDVQYSGKDYRKEVRSLEAIVRRYGRSGKDSWLDVACGTGKHLELLRRHYRCVGVDANRAMLRVARRRLRGVRLVHGDMGTFRLGEEFDVVSCLFSSIGHLTSERDLRRAFANFARHLKPGGIAIVEPWILPSRTRPGRLDLRTFRDRTVRLVRMAHSDVRGRSTVIQYHYLIGAPGRGIRHIEESDRGLMVDSARLQELMKSAGLRPRFLPGGFVRDRGLLLGVKPLARQAVPR